MKEALKLALEALEGADWYINQLEMTVYSVDDDGTHEKRLKVQQALTKIKEALAQPEQEPVAFADCRAERICRSWCGNSACASHWVDATPPKPEQKPVEDVVAYHSDGTRTVRISPKAQNFCSRCGKRTPDLTTIHTCTPPRGLEMT
jgi:hypothetical protein